MPGEREGGEQQGSNRHRDHEEGQRRAIDHDHQRIDAGRGMKGAGEVHRRHGKPDRGGRGPWRRPGRGKHSEADDGGDQCPPTSARGWAGSACGVPITSTIEVANGTIISGKAASSDSHCIAAMATAPPAAPR